MHLPQPFNTAPRRVHRKRQPQLPSAPPIPPGPPINVTGVNTDDPPTAGYSYWMFDPTLTCTGNTIGLQVFVGGVWIDPVAADQGGANTINVYYDTAETLDGKPYRIIVTPSGIVQAANIVLPQNGTVQAP